ncbi:MAG: hypothetical protein TQ35_0006850 [Candidatus Aramenus sulfurataquae]|jgi:hypothetical protein|uniref:Uncharacterized protein n=2 Tax=Candidatus Aramenus sulfurataquae TaxID=1326980 RepID=A0AAE3FM09_9CREN|nr:hypothetical protein [Candidatus Aramenus sulfurataquae]
MGGISDPLDCWANEGLDRVSMPRTLALQGGSQISKIIMKSKLANTDEISIRKEDL